MRLQRFDEALVSLAEARRLAPEDAEIHYFLGLLHARTGDYVKAADMLTVAVAARPDWLDARQKLAVAYLKSGKVEESKRELATLKKMQEELEKKRLGASFMGTPFPLARAPTRGAPTFSPRSSSSLS